MTDDAAITTRQATRAKRWLEAKYDIAWSADHIVSTLMRKGAYRVDPETSVESVPKLTYNDLYERGEHPESDPDFGGDREETEFSRDYLFSLAGKLPPLKVSGGMASAYYLDFTGVDVPDPVLNFEEYEAPETIVWDGEAPEYVETTVERDRKTDEYAVTVSTDAGEWTIEFLVPDRESHRFDPDKDVFMTATNDIFWTAPEWFAEKGLNDPFAGHTEEYREMDLHRRLAFTAAFAAVAREVVPRIKPDKEFATLVDYSSGHETFAVVRL